MNARMHTVRTQDNGKDDSRYYAISFRGSNLINIFFCDSLIGQVSSLEEAKQLAAGHYNTLMGDYYE